MLLLLNCRQHLLRLRPDCSAAAVAAAGADGRGLASAEHSKAPQTKHVSTWVNHIRN
jgi:hypothetical protein